MHRADDNSIVPPQGSILAPKRGRCVDGVFLSTDSQIEHIAFAMEKSMTRRQFSRRCEGLLGK
ncbi:hypothetical protein HNR26_002966 [Rhizobium rosettiformans]|jgi:hypothetical protein|uniref:Uncharacterized protein n=1 Tax=Rhizobium rosettiformans TaxID=1368430 RepID=A0A7W8HRU0_9HYPH|nr:hypothetical protein [Rhizobium rosettiformans]